MCYCSVSCLFSFVLAFVVFFSFSDEKVCGRGARHVGHGTMVIPLCGFASLPERASLWAGAFVTAVGCCGRRLVCGLVGCSLIGSPSPFRLLIVCTACSCRCDLYIVCCRGLHDEGTIWGGRNKRA